MCAPIPYTYLAIRAAAFFIAISDPQIRSDETGDWKEKNATEILPQVTLLQGQITDAIGVGVSGATVTLYRRNTDGSRGQKVADAITDKFGDFNIDSDSPLKASGIAVIEKGKFQPLQREVELGGEDVPFLGESLRGTLTLTGTVVSAPNNQPIPAAQVSLRQPGDERTVTADDEGKFRFEGVSPGGLALFVVAQGFGRERKTLNEFADDDVITFIIKPERVITLKVQDEAGTLVTGALIEILDQKNNDLKSALSDSEGQITLKGLNFDTRVLLVRVSHAAYVCDVEFNRSLDLPADKADSEHVLSVVRGGQVTGILTETATDHPVHGARVSAGDDYSDQLPHAFSDQSGRFQISGVPPGPTCITAHASGFAPELEIIDVLAGQVATVEIQLNAGHTVEGLITSEGGNPVSDAAIASLRWRGKKTLSLRTITDGQGKFTFEHVPNDEFEVSVTAPAFEPLLASIKSGERVELVLKLGESEPSTFGDLIAIGTPVPDVTVIDTSGKSFHLPGLKGKIIVLDFWATWCPPCVAELPEFAAAYKKHKSDDVTFLALSRDHDPADLAAFLKKNPDYSWPQSIGKESGVSDAASKFSVKYIPALFVVDREGKIAASGIAASQLSEKLDSLKSQAPTP